MSSRITDHATTPLRSATTGGATMTRAGCAVFVRGGLENGGGDG